MEIFAALSLSFLATIYYPPSNRNNLSTGGRVMQCWARDLGDCDDKASREHYISKGIFADKMIKVSGLPWCHDEEVRISLASATAKILCKRHNEQLSPFDHESSNLAGFLRDSVVCNPKQDASVTLNGRLLEKWAFKTAFNLAFLQAFRGQRMRPSRRHLDILYRNAPVPEGMGLYNAERVLASTDYNDGISWLEVCDTHTGTLVGVELVLAGLRLFVCTVAERADRISVRSRDGSELVLGYRPGKITMEGVRQAGTKIINLEW